VYQRGKAEEYDDLLDTRFLCTYPTRSERKFLSIVNASAHDNERSFYRLLGSDNEIGQCMLLYEMSGGEQSEKLVSGDSATARLTVFVKTPDSESAKEFYEALVTFIESETSSEYAFSFVAFLADLFLMPSLILVLRPFGEGGGR